MIIHNDIEQGSDEWFALRAGIPTASEFSKLITSTGLPSKSINDHAIVMAGEKHAGKPLDRYGGNQYTDAGNEREELARKYYDFTTGNTVEQVGFITDRKNATCGCSPDGLVADDGMLEIKSLAVKAHIKAILYYKNNGNIPTDYVQQIQGQMMIAKRKWCDLLLFHPDLPSLIIRCYPIPEVINGLKSQIKIANQMRDSILNDLEWA